MIVLAFSG